MKKLVFAILVSFFCFHAQAQTTIEASNTNFQYVGRIDFTNTNAPKFHYPGTHFNIKFTGTSLKAKFADENWGGGQYIGFIIDGGAEIIKNIGNNTTNQTVDVASGLTNTTHTLTCFKRSGQPDGFLRFEGLILDTGAGVSAPAARPTRRIELIGDSVTEGVNADNTVDSEGGVSKANAWNSYGMILARRLNAECHNTAISGLAVINGTGSYNSHVGGVGLETTYTKMSANDGRQTNWDFNRWTPHVVIMAMGINDHASTNAGNKENWKNKYKTIINDLRNTKYPEAEFVFTVPPLGQQYPAISGYIQEIVTELNDPDVHYFDLTATAPAAHPNKAKQIEFANQLEPFINGLTINWGVNVPVSSVSLNSTTLSVPANGTGSLLATVAPSTASNKAISWSSSNTSIATINSSGVVSGMSVGSATITVTTTDGAKTATCAVTVTAAQPTQNCGLLENFGFETNTFVKWNNSGNNAAITTDKKSGSYAAEITGAGGLNYGSLINVQPGRRIKLTFYGKISGSPTSPQVGIDYINSAGTEIGEITKIVSGANYAQFTIEVVPKAGTTKLQIWSYKGGTGKLFLDDFCLTESNDCGLVTNYGFENGLAGWTNTNSVASTSTSAQSGSTAAVLTGTAGFNRASNIAVTPGHKINFEVYAKIEGSPQYAQIGLDYLDAAGVIKKNKVFNINTTAYTKYSSSEIPPSGTTQVLVWTYKNTSAGKIFIDDMCMTTQSAARIGLVENEIIGQFSLGSNPVQDYIEIKILNKSILPLEAEIVNLVGARVLKNTFLPTNGVVIIPVNKLPSGYYLLKIGQGEKVVTRKIIKR